MRLASNNFIHLLHPRAEMLNSLRCLCKKSITQVINTTNSVQPINNILRKSYASHSKASHLYTNFMNSGPDLTKDSHDDKASRWMKNNETVFPPQDPSEPKRPAVSLIREGLFVK